MTRPQILVAEVIFRQFDELFTEIYAECTTVGEEAYNKQCQDKALMAHPGKTLIYAHVIDVSTAGDTYMDIMNALSRNQGASSPDEN
jgi:hypothetical protein